MKKAALTVRKLLKKLLSRGADEKAREYFGTGEYRNQFIVSEFAGDARGLLRKRIEELKGTGEFNAEVIRVEGDGPKILLEVKNDPRDIEMELSGVREAEILPFSYIMKELIDLFKEKGLARKDLHDPIMRAIQYIVRIQESTPEKE
jgi:limonene-1,2-epoxide hydrolase